MVEIYQNRPSELSADEGRQTRAWMQARHGVVEPIGGFNFARERNQRPDDPFADPKFSENGGRWPGFGR